MAFPLPVKKPDRPKVVGPSDAMPATGGGAPPPHRSTFTTSDTPSAAPGAKGPPAGFPPRQQPPGTKKKKARTNQFALPATPAGVNAATGIRT